MSGLVRRHSVGITAVVLLLTAFQLMSFSIAYPTMTQLGSRSIATVVSPLSKIFHEFDQSGRYVLNHYVWLQGVEQERNELQAKLDELEKQNSMLIELAHENDRLRELLDFSSATNLTGVASQVIGRNPSNWYQTITIDKGSDDGIAAGMPVVDGYAVVGQTTAVSASSAVVLLLTDNTSAIDALVQTTRAVGIAEGTLSAELKLSYVVKDPPVQIGDRVLASGLDGVYPKGVLVGLVTEVDASDKGMFQHITVRPSVDTNRLETVLVLTHVKDSLANADKAPAVDTNKKAETKKETKKEAKKNNT